jgi:hypothetical protein
MSAPWPFSPSILLEVTLGEHLALIVEEHRQAVAARLSSRKALLVAVLLDHFADRIFAQFRTSMPDFLPGADDLPAWRAKLAAQSAALAAIFALGSGQARLRIDSVEVPIADYSALSVEDFMVSLYNGNSVQRVMLVGLDGVPVPAHDVLAAALAYWQAATARADRGGLSTTTGP